MMTTVARAVAATLIGAMSVAGAVVTGCGAGAGISVAS